MRPLVVITALLGALVLAASALAVMPRARASFTGVNSSEKPINGFRPTVTFRVSPNGRVLTNFEFQTLGCFGIGRFPAGVDPYAESTWRVKTVAVGRLGTFAAKVKPVLLFPDGTKMTATIAGTFAKPDQTTGTIIYRMSINGSVCGPRTLKFTGRAG
jgi:hypothetical protein